ncbi:MAG: hypothetical protein AAFR21_11670 [Pseudomonadota bacterium]
MIGLPNSEEHYTYSVRRRGVAVQFSWRDYFDTVAFVDEDFPRGHPLHAARKVVPKDGEAARADLFPCYSLRRQQIYNLRDLGLNVTFGATCSDFIDAAEQAFCRGGLLSVLTHFEPTRGFEFCDGFLSVEEIAIRRRPSGHGLLDAVTCRSGEVANSIKLAMGPATWAYAPHVPLGLSAALLHRTELWTSVLETPRTFLEHLQVSHRRLIELGIPTGARPNAVSAREEGEKNNE